MNPLNSKLVLETLGHPGAYGGQPPHWEKAIAEMPDGILPFLDKSQLKKRRLDAGLDQALEGPLSGIADTLNTDPALKAFAWYMHWRVFVAPQHGIPWGAPSLQTYLGEKAGLFYLLLSLEHAPRLWAWHAKLGYPAEVTQETLRQISCFSATHLKGRSCPGIYEIQFPWLANYLVQPYVRLGRLEYQLHPYEGGIGAWKQKETGAVIALADNNTRVAKNGLLLKPDAPKSEGWVATLERTKDSITGYPVDPAGYILQKKISLPLKTWQPCLTLNDTVLDLHIPAGGAMDWDSIRSSLAKALEFFKKHHPDKPCSALVVTTWFMDPQLSNVLPHDSNPLKFQRSAYLYPSKPDPECLWHIFLHSISDTPAKSLPQGTSLLKNIAAYLEKGNTWHGGSMFLLPEDMANPTENLYHEKFNRSVDQLLA